MEGSTGEGTSRFSRPGSPGPVPGSPLRSRRLLPEDFDGYEILGILGRGGMSVVYEARQANLDRGVALKMLVGGVHASSRAVARLRAESATIAGLRHPGIVAIHDVGEHRGVPYLCLELFAGGSLADRLEGKPLPPAGGRASRGDPRQGRAARARKWRDSPRPQAGERPGGPPHRDPARAMGAP